MLDYFLHNERTPHVIINKISISVGLLSRETYIWYTYQFRGCLLHVCVLNFQDCSCIFFSWVFLLGDAITQSMSYGSVSLRMGAMRKVKLVTPHPNFDHLYPHTCSNLFVGNTIWDSRLSGDSLISVSRICQQSTFLSRVNVSIENTDISTTNFIRLRWRLPFAFSLLKRSALISNLRYTHLYCFARWYSVTKKRFCVLTSIEKQQNIATQQMLQYQTSHTDFTYVTHILRQSGLLTDVVNNALPIEHFSFLWLLNYLDMKWSFRWRSNLPYTRRQHCSSPTCHGTCIPQT